MIYVLSSLAAKIYKISGEEKEMEIKNPPYFLLKENTEDKNILINSFSTNWHYLWGSLPNQ